jgi:hypothetical protein
MLSVCVDLYLPVTPYQLQDHMADFYKTWVWA